MSTEMTQEDKDFIKEITDDLKRAFVTSGEVSMKTAGDFLSKMSPEDVAHLGKTFKLYGYGGIIPAIKDSLDSGSVDPIFKYALGTIVTAIILPVTARLLPAIAIAFFIGIVADKVYDIVQNLGETIGENEIKKLNDLQEKIFDWSTKIDEKIGDDFDYSNAEVIVEDKNRGNTVRITDGVKNYIFDDDYDSSIIGSYGDDIIYLGDGRNVVNSGFGHDEIHGGKNVDIVYGGDGNDVLDGGGGSDTLNGGYGNDTYIYKRGYEGVLTINDEGSRSDTDRVLFGEGIDGELWRYTIKNSNNNIHCEAA